MVTQSHLTKRITTELKVKTAKTLESSLYSRLKSHLPCLGYFLISKAKALDLMIPKFRSTFKILDYLK